MTLLVYFFGVFLSIIAAVYQALYSTPFVHDITWQVVMTMGLIFIIPYYFFITDEVSPGAGDNLIAVSILLQLAEYYKKPENSGNLIVEKKIIDVEQNDMVVFDSNYVHESQSNKSDDVRIVFSANMMKNVIKVINPNTNKWEMKIL